MYQLVEQAEPEGLEVRKLKMMLDSTLKLERTVKTRNLKIYLDALPGYFLVEDYISEGGRVRIVSVTPFAFCYNYPNSPATTTSSYALFTDLVCNSAPLRLLSMASFELKTTML